MYKDILEQKLNDLKSLKKEIKLLKKIIAIQEDNYSVKSIQDFYSFEQIQELSLSSVQKIFKNFICEVQYQKQSGEIRIFNECSMCNDYIDFFNEQNEDSLTSFMKKEKSVPRNNNKYIFVIENINETLHLKKLIFKNILSIKILS